MDKNTERICTAILEKELVPALGCTEPIALAFAAAKAREVLGCFPERMELDCSGNIVKNVRGVTIPNSGGLMGVDSAVILGAVGGNAADELKVLESVTAADTEKTGELKKTDFLRCRLKEGVANLYIDVRAYAGEHSAEVRIVNRHTLITRIVKDGEVLFHKDPVEKKPEHDTDGLSIRSILEYAGSVDVERIKPVLLTQVRTNLKISDEGLRSDYGARIGKTILEVGGDGVRSRAAARAAAGADARMNGCSLPVIINSGSGNQGLIVSMPVYEYAREWNVGEDRFCRALAVSNLLSVYQKHYIGSLSAFCGAVTAASAAGAAITWMAGGDYDAVCRTITNTLANVGGIICDGAKSSCAAKMASAVDAAILGHELSMRGIAFRPGEGIVSSDTENTVRNVGYVGRVGMKNTDIEVLNLMLEN